MVAICHDGVGAFLPCSIYVPILWSAVSRVSALHPRALLQFPGLSFLLAKGFLPGWFLCFVTKDYPWLRSSLCQAR